MAENYNLRFLTDEAERDKRKSCLLCRHEKLRRSGTLVQCEIHPNSGVHVDSVDSDYAFELRIRAKACHDFDGEI